MGCLVGVSADLSTGILNVISSSSSRSRTWYWFGLVKSRGSAGLGMMGSAMVEELGRFCE